MQNIVVLAEDYRTVMRADTRGPIVSALRLLIVSAVAAVFIASCTQEQAPQLPSLAADLAQTSVSGLSAGAYMAGQFQVAHSRIVVGAGLIAGGPYGCAQSRMTENMSGPGVAFINLAKAINGCMLHGLKLWGVPNIDRLIENAKKFAAEGKIDPLSDLADDQVYLFSAAKDRTVVPAIVAAAEEFYRKAGIPPHRLAFLRDQPGGHAILTKSAGLECGTTGKPYLNACNYDQVAAMLAHIYGSLKTPKPAKEENFISFDQRPFTRGIGKHGLADVGSAYLPTGCRASGKCRIHIAFHGCGQGKEGVQSPFVRRSGYAEWAEANNLIVLFPHATGSAINPDACWDWWGYSGADYLTKDGPQIRAVRAMLDRLASARLAL